jgi:hypothetical protein
MRAARFKHYLFGLLEKANNPEIAKVEPFDAAGQKNIRVVGTDGVIIELMIVGSKPHGGGDWKLPEVAVAAPGRDPRPIDDGWKEWQHPDILNYRPPKEDEEE